MADIDCHSEMTNFHRDNVTLSNKQQGEMRTRRDAGRTRLENGQRAGPCPGLDDGPRLHSFCRASQVASFSLMAARYGICAR